MASHIVDQQNLEARLQETLSRLTQGCAGTVSAIPMELVDCCAATGTAVFAVQAEPWMGNPNGCLHGGMCAVLLDMALGILVGCLPAGPRRNSVTVELRMGYLRPAPLGEPLHLHAQVIKTGNTLLYATGSICRPGEAEQPLTTAEAVYFSSAPHEEGERA